MTEITTPELIIDVRRLDGSPPTGEDLARAGQRVRVAVEPLTYRRDDNTVSYFRDRVLAADGHAGAERRLQRHATEMRVEGERRDQQARMVAAQNGFEFRVNPNRAVGQGGYFAPPLWLIKDFASASQPGRTLGALIPRFDLPSGVQSVNVPRLTTATSTGPALGGQAVSGSDIVDAAVTSTVSTIAGEGVVPLQMLEQSPLGAAIDWAIFKDLAASYDFSLEKLLYVGSGTGAAFTGLLLLAGTTKVTYDDASPTGPEMVTPLGKVAAQVGDARLLPPEVWLMRTARWAWLASAQDTATMPLAPFTAPPAPGTYPFDAVGVKPVTSMMGWPVFLSDAIPATLTRSTGNLVGGTEDAIVACRPTDMMLFESDQRTTVDQESLSGTMQVRVQLHGHAAALVGRYPSGVGLLQGTGFAVQTGY